MSPPADDKAPATAARTVPSVSAVPRRAWNRLLDDDDTPFVRHEFLDLLESSGSVGAGSGWTPCHVVIGGGAGADDAIAAVAPLYIKDHSYGEYVFDWAWARAYEQHGISYYPKLVCAVPFTPVTSRKLLAAGATRSWTGTLIRAIGELARGDSFSSVHALFLDAGEAAIFADHGYLMRHDNQFHWSNRGYQDFDDFLARFTSKKRKNIRAERRRIADAGITFRWLTGAEISAADWHLMYELYCATIAEHGGYPYLTRDFFLGLGLAMGERVLLLKGTQYGEELCAALYFRSRNTLYGRYWGARRFISHLHFETCYYQPIEYAISTRLAGFEAGAQGIHKLGRGLAPAVTRSAHWLKHPGFHDAVDRYLELERHEQARHARLLEESLPFRRNPADGADG